MKKLLAAVCAGCLVISTAMTTFAQLSVVISGNVEKAEATDASGNAVEIVIDDLNKKMTEEEVEKVLEELKETEFVENLLGDDFVEGMQIVDVRDVSLANAENVTFPLDITFQVPGVTENSKVGVLHFDTTKEEWEKIESKPGNGTITGTFNSLSPVAFLVDGETAKSSGTSPKTGDMSKLPTVMAGVCVLALAGMVGTSRKKRA